MLLDIAFFGLAFVFAIPAVSGYFAHSHGRSFWLWFVIGCFLPIISYFIIAYLCRKQAIKSSKLGADDLCRYEDEYMEKQINETLIYRHERKKIE
jgi:phosphotransferase system  glucose/maltose/N-acetylglucosamine-specific IIC component